MEFFMGLMEAFALIGLFVLATWLVGNVNEASAGAKPPPEPKPVNKPLPPKIILQEAEQNG